MYALFKHGISINVNTSGTTMSANSQPEKERQSLSELAMQMKALGDETRLALMQNVAASRCDNGACICDLTPQTNLAQSTVSHHMKLLVEAGLLTRTQEGKWAFYDLTPSGLAMLDALNLSPGRGCGCSHCD